VSLRDYPHDEITEGTVQAYLACPRTTAKSPGILVIHEKFGLTSYIKDVVRRLARLGYVALAPDLLWRQGGTAAIGDSGQVAAILGGLSPDVMISDLRACVSSLSAMDGVRGDRIGAIGFCFGGGLAWRLATREPRLAAVVPFYGPNPPLADVPSISAPILGIYAGIDERINPGIDVIEREMNRFSRTFEVAVLPDSLHAFHNDTLPERYHPRAAQEAWAMATAWLARYLSAP
jgi:carboxymethylenebutenolidase